MIVPGTYIKYYEFNPPDSVVYAKIELIDGSHIFMSDNKHSWAIGVEWLYLLEEIPKSEYTAAMVMES